MGSILMIVVLVCVAFFTLTNAYNKERCDAKPSVKGDCKSHLHRWVFKDKKCQRMTYGGCGATPNIFLFRYKCKRDCLSKKSKHKHTEHKHKNKHTTRKNKHTTSTASRTSKASTTPKT